MSINCSRILSSMTIFFVIATVAYPTNGLESRKLDESTVLPGDQGVKCTPSCIQSPPPPPLPSRPPACPPPPAPKKPPPTQYCPPPPPVPPSPPYYIYITGPPGSLYPIDQNFGGADRNVAVGLLALVSGLFLLLAF
ncbi:hypothetical protein HRI_000755600 [Hibiscus trionum]|uniref:Uncharacterized protein n=1 Tax=Hibiscus trionum TaxID=183268 RepID=A0A9W7LN95_HIBTR|nr:hypothetical protein HRI_000755600 [Hibiscus trionum]